MRLGHLAPQTMRYGQSAVEKLTSFFQQIRWNRAVQSAGALQLELLGACRERLGAGREREGALCRTGKLKLRDAGVCTVVGGGFFAHISHSLPLFREKPTIRIRIFSEWSKALPLIAGIDCPWDRATPNQRSDRSRSSLIGERLIAGPNGWQRTAEGTLRSKSTPADVHIAQTRGQSP